MRIMEQRYLVGLSFLLPAVACSQFFFIQFLTYFSPFASRRQILLVFLLPRSLQIFLAHFRKRRKAGACLNPNCGHCQIKLSLSLSGN